MTGGGARAAYQVGVLSAIMELLDPDWHTRFRNPFQIICGTSAGAINAAALACRADRPHLGVRRIRRLWSSLNTDMIYRADAPGLIRTGVRWLGLLSLGWMYSGLTRKRPTSLLDNSPMQALLGRVLDFQHLRANLESGALSALAITASGYTSGEHLTFYQAHTPIEPWHRYLRLAIPTPIGIDHLMASSAIPFVFPARQVQVHGKGEWCGDGSMRQLAPISPAIHLGAHRVLVIGTGFRDDTHPENREDSPPYPSLAQVGGHALASIFLDGLSSDVERLQRMNALMELAGDEGGGSLRRVDVLTITPSQSLDLMALEHLQDMPAQARALFRVLGVSSDPGRPGGGSLMSYLLFESSYTKRLIELGYADTMQRNDEVIAFFKEAQA
ncbi:patatin-like phospholipase family protein [Achromobacter denitrificans]|uniref:Patatin-like phospholipase family protein n=1 Tax=Achromobacter denitrificans TaxID=32002 RepID=A0A6N0JVC9_ACHDE|nr:MULTISPECIES: patatin-like phospholipase family protein [Achromobacter]ASC68877.1 Patatin [Achromobacter denitrificans]MBV2159397.1 patatin-like phospholipase family protein [Achromobacter denitrificans]MDX3882647.1 patatin-like phospholipase family protein [Achromobacter sp.]OLU07680.1 Patatin [Achromobacter denitrificans]QCS66962.1 patatin-like phospholipase family protein [Achromobacter denitrificans]